MSWISCIPGTSSSRNAHTFIQSKPYLNAEERVMLQSPHNTLTLEVISIMSMKLLSPSSSSSSTSDILTSSSMLYSSSSFSSAMIGEYIGMESCIDLNNDIEGDEEVIRDQRHDEGRRKRDHDDQRCMMKRKEFPPPITSLARTENQPSSRMPWVLKRYYTNDGRLILTEEKVKHHEYFKAHRSNGRLTLQLVPLDEDEDDPICDGNENDGCININEENNGNGNDDDENDDFVIDQFDLVQLVSAHVNENKNENEYDGNQKETDVVKLTSVVPENEYDDDQKEMDVVKLTSLPPVNENEYDGDQKEMDVVKLTSLVNESLPIGSGSGKCLIHSNVGKISPCLIIEVPAIRPVH